MKTFTAQVATATMMAQANSFMIKTDPTALIQVASDTDHHLVQDDLSPEMIDEDGMLIWSMIAEHFERDRMAGVCEFC